MCMPMEGEKSRHNIMVPRALWDEFQALCNENGLTCSGVISVAIRAFVDSEKVTLKTLMTNAIEGLLTDEKSSKATSAERGRRKRR